MDNVRIRYYAFQQSHGYATGIDMKVNGEFVKGIESWLSFSLMKTEEDVYGDYYLNPDGMPVIQGRMGYIRALRPTGECECFFPGLPVRATRPTKWD